jgi:nitroimidazol reductase NimA-like FMN-containing flavoprotein (pyridoxamine 5'-phosphate oxidase superfamily)
MMSISLTHKETGMTQIADTQFKREAKRGSHDFNLACGILDAGKVCHVGFTLNDQPYVVPMAYARLGDRLLIHGSVASRLMKNLASGLRCCVTVTHFDGLVYARSTFNSSMNYRSVMVFGVAEPVTGAEEKRSCIQALVDHLMPGRRAELRQSTSKELNATSLLSLPIETFSCKVRSGPPADSKSDLDAPVWAGVVPLGLTAGEPVDAPDLLPGIGQPDYL